MAKLRSPNYPNRNLSAALDMVQKIYAKDGRNKISRIVIAGHMGHDGLSGPALGKIGALRAYGLIDGVGDELRVTEDAITALMAPKGSNERLESIRRLAINPVLFQDIRKQFTGKVSVESLTFWLVQSGFSPTAAPIAARTYFDTMEFAGGLEAEYDTPKSDEVSSSIAEPITEPPQSALQRQGLKTMAGERELTTGMLSKNAAFRLIVSGPIGAKEIDRLIAKLQLDKEILAEPDPEEAALDLSGELKQ